MEVNLLIKKNQLPEKMKVWNTVLKYFLFHNATLQITIEFELFKSSLTIHLKIFGHHSQPFFKFVDLI